MDLKQLEYFVRVAELGGFTKAAAVLSVAQPALSKQIRQLEVELQRNLLMRNGRGVSLTEEGAMLLSHAKGILEQVDRARQEIRDIQGLPIGKVIVAAPPMTSSRLGSQSPATSRKSSTLRGFAMPESQSPTPKSKPAPKAERFFTRGA